MSRTATIATNRRQRELFSPKYTDPAPLRKNKRHTNAMRCLQLPHRVKINFRTTSIAASKKLLSNPGLSAVALATSTLSMMPLTGLTLSNKYTLPCAPARGASCGYLSVRSISFLFGAITRRVNRRSAMVKVAASPGHDQRHPPFQKKRDSLQPLAVARSD